MGSEVVVFEVVTVEVGDFSRRTFRGPPSFLCLLFFESSLWISFDLGDAEL
jgi:hypothetical protein